MKASHVELKQSLSIGPSIIMLLIKLSFKIYNIDIFIIIIGCCLNVCLLTLILCF